jgi:DNA-binding Lrp family transcriptional regulator
MIRKKNVMALVIEESLKASLDSSDLLILESLVNNSRISLIEIGKKAGLSRFAVRKRVEKLFSQGIVFGPAVVLNPFLIGFKRTVFFEFKTNPHEPWLAKLLEKTNACDLVYGITGEYSLFGRFRLVDDEHFSRVLKKIDDAMAKSFFKKYRVVNAIQVFKESDVAFKAKETGLKLDEADLRILEILLNQGEFVKTPFPVTTVQLSQLLRRFGLKISQPTVFQRLAKLEKNGVIAKNTMRVDWAKLGLKTKVIVRVKANPNMYNVVAQNFLASMNEITDLYRTGEEYGLLAIVRVRDISEYNSFLLKLYDVPDVIDTSTTLVLEERKNSPTFLRKEQL